MWLCSQEGGRLHYLVSLDNVTDLHQTLYKHICQLRTYTHVFKLFAEELLVDGYYYTKCIWCPVATWWRDRTMPEHLHKTSTSSRPHNSKYF